MEPKSNVRPVSALEVLIWAILTVHAIIYLNPASQAFQFSNYAVMNSIAAANVWGFGYLLISLTWAFGMLRQRGLLRNIGSTVTGVVFVFMAATFVLSTAGTTVIGWVMLILGGWAFVVRVQLR